MKALTELVDDFAKYKELIQQIHMRVAELDNIWLYFQKFIDEQGNDQVIKIRSSEFGILDKLNSLEWIARYIEYISPEIVYTACKVFMEGFSNQDSAKAQAFTEFEHTSECIPTVMTKIRQKEVEFKDKRLSFTQWDDANYMLLLVLEALVLNDDCLDMLVKIEAMDIIGRFLLAQRQQPDIEQIDDAGKVIEPATGDPNLLEYKGLFRRKDYATKNGRPIIMNQFPVVIRFITSYLRSREGMDDFMRDPRFMQKVLTSAEESEEIDLISNYVKIFRMVLRQP